MGDGVTGLVLVEGLPGSGKSTTASDIASWLAGQGVPAEHWPEGRVDHPVDFEQVAVLSTEQVLAIAAESSESEPQSSSALLTAAERHGDEWLVRHALHPSLPSSLVERLREHDAYDGSVAPDAHARVLTESWRAFGRTRPVSGPVQVWECVLLQNPGCALVARGDQPAPVLAAHVSGLVEAVREHRPALVYLDAGDPLRVLETVAAERAAGWVEAVVEYHTGQGLGRRMGLRGFEGYVDFMRHRRAMELDLIGTLDLPTLVVPVDADHARGGAARLEQVRTFLSEHLQLDGWPEPSQVA